MEALTMDVLALALLIGSAALFVIGLIRLTFWD